MPQNLVSIANRGNVVRFHSDRCSIQYNVDVCHIRSGQSLNQNKFRVITLASLLIITFFCSDDAELFVQFLIHFFLMAASNFCCNQIGVQVKVKLGATMHVLSLCVPSKQHDSSKAHLCRHLRFILHLIDLWSPLIVQIVTLLTLDAFLSAIILKWRM